MIAKIRERERESSVGYECTVMSRMLQGKTVYHWSRMELRLGRENMIQ